MVGQHFSELPNVLVVLPFKEVNNEMSPPPSIGEFTEALNSLKRNKSPGPDGIHSELLNCAALLHVLLHS